jgi:MFS family permease
MREVLLRREFRLLFVGLAASMFGDSVMLLATAVWMKTLTGSNSQAGLVTLALIAPALLAPALGWIVDRYRRRPFLIVGNLGSAAMLLPLYLVHGAGDAWLLYAVALLYGVSFVMLDAGLSGLLKELLPGELLVQANGLLATVRQGLRLIGPLVGAGALAAFGPVPVVTLNLVSFLAAALAVALLRVPEARPERSERHWLAEMTAGLRHLAGQPTLARTMLGVGLATLTIGALEAPLFAYVDKGLHRPATFVGVLATMEGVGGILGGLSAPRVVRRLGEVGAIGLGVAVLGTGVSLLVLPVLPVGLASGVVVGGGLALAVVGINTLLQRRTPARLMGRVSAATDMVISLPQAVSVVAGAVLVAVVDYRVLFAVAGAATVLDGLYLLRARRHDAGPAVEVEAVGGEERELVSSALPAAP